MLTKTELFSKILTKIELFRKFNQIDISGNFGQNWSFVENVYHIKIFRDFLKLLT